MLIVLVSPVRASDLMKIIVGFSIVSPLCYFCSSSMRTSKETSVDIRKSHVPIFY